MNVELPVPTDEHAEREGTESLRRYAEGEGGQAARGISDEKVGAGEVGPNARMNNLHRTSYGTF
jgi:hypothetical protein